VQNQVRVQNKGRKLEFWFLTKICMFPVVIDRPVLTGVSTGFGGYGAAPTVGAWISGHGET
jgi:hypothetical protein